MPQRLNRFCLSNNPPSLRGYFILKGRNMELTQKDIDRFWSHVDKSGDCWIWTAAKKRRDYGGFVLHGKGRYAHRVSWQITYGDIPDGMNVLHHCDNPSCVNPNHLFLGNQSDNARDMVSKGRMNFQRHPETRPTGDRHGSHTHPESRTYGERNGAFTHPERIPRGDRNGARLHPESYARGEKVHNAKLTNADVEYIRNSTGITQKDLGKKLGVDQSVISRVLNKLRWKHI